MLRKVMTCVVGAVLATTVMTGTASAAGVKGAYGSKASCTNAAKNYAEKYSVGPCYHKSGKGWYFKYW